MTSESDILIDESYYRRPPGVPTRPAAGGVVVRMDGTKVLCALIREGNWDKWVLPKGGIEAGEDEETAARREIEEEAGLTHLVLLDKLGICERLAWEKTHWSLTHFFLFAATQEAIAPLDAAHHPQQCAWFPLDDLPPMMWPEQQKLLETNRQQIQEAVSKYFETVQA
jgi:8-oxo-dGTP pyrophosphatase MutT (NUDIX family)